MIANIPPLLASLKTALGDIYRGRLKGVYLFGSYARGDAGPDSDVDVLIVLDQVDRYGVEVDQTGAVASRLSLEYGVSISRVFVSEREWREGDTSFLANARGEAVPA